MEQRIKDTLAELEAWGEANDARETDRSRKMLNLEPETALFISILARSSRRRQILEIGTSNGYSAIWLAWSARQTGGHVTTIDHSAAKRALAEENLARAGVADLVTLHTGDAGEVLSTLPGPFDLVFLDADRYAYPSYLPVLLPKLTPGGIILADNVHSHPQEIAGYLDAIAARDDFDHVVIGVGKGLSVAYQRG